jgi:multidrug efflux pump subunit AcrA (membrane-fusion protein)
MVKETNLLSQLINVEQAGAKASAEAVRQAEQRNAEIQATVAEFNELMAKLRSEEDEVELECLEEEAQELAEELEIEFVYTRADGTIRTYTPAAFWEPSGGCEWVESAQWGYDYGWNI